MAHLTREGLRRAKCPVRGAKITILGWAFLANSDDTRNTPSEPYRDILIGEGAQIVVHDPYVSEYPGIDILSDLDQALQSADAVVIFAGHNQYAGISPVTIRKLSGKKHPVIVDGRNLVEPDVFIRQGFIYKGIGRGDKNEHAIING